jgi:hypothetical protein
MEKGIEKRGKHNLVRMRRTVVAIGTDTDNFAVRGDTVQSEREARKMRGRKAQEAVSEPRAE